MRVSGRFGRIGPLVRAAIEPAIGPRVRDRGFALVAVLWFLILLAFLASSFSASSRTGAYLARNLEDNAEAEALADAGVHRAIWELLQLSDEQPLRADGTVYGWAFGGGLVRFSVQGELGKVDLNAAPQNLLEQLFLAVGVDGAEAAALAQAIADFRGNDEAVNPASVQFSPDEDTDFADTEKQPFLTVDDLQQVPGITQPIYERVRPSVTVYTGSPQPLAAIAPPDVRSALQAMGLDASDGGGLFGDQGGGASAYGAGQSGAPGPAGDAAGGGGAGSLAVVEAGARPDAAEALGGASLVAQVVEIHAEGQTAAGAVFSREAVLELGPGDPPYRLFVWRQGDRRYFARDDTPTMEE